MGVRGAAPPLLLGTIQTDRCTVPHGGRFLGIGLAPGLLRRSETGHARGQAGGAGRGRLRVSPPPSQQRRKQRHHRALAVGG